MISGCPICECRGAIRTPRRNAEGLSTSVLVECPTCGLVAYTLAALSRLDRGLYTEQQFGNIAKAVLAMRPDDRAQVLDAGQLDRLARFGADGW
jgi:hypothetical protein